MAYQCITNEMKDNCQIITINMPEAENKLNIQCMEEIADAMIASTQSDECRTVILTSAGEYFCNGGELGDFRCQSPKDIMSFGDSFIKLHTTITSLSKPVIAVVQGHAKGGGFSLVEACDLAVASEEATFGVPEVNAGLAPMMALAGVSNVLTRKGSMELALLGAPITASRALEIGLVNRVCSKEDIMAEALEMAEKMHMSNPFAISLCKRLYREARDLDYRGKLQCGLNMLVSLLKSEDAHEVLTAREEGRAPAWKNR